VIYLVKVFKEVKAFLSWNSFLTTTAECSFKCFYTQCPHTLFKLKRFIFIRTNTQFLKWLLWQRNVRYGLTLPFTCSFSWRALFTKATPTNVSICHDFNYQINKRKTPTTCLTNHKSSISHHITPLVINSLGDGHTHTHTRIFTSWTKAISRNQSRTGQRPVCAWFKNWVEIDHCYKK